MKDLYFKLDIDPDASAEEVAAALAIKPEMSACSSILLDEEKRSVYDRTRSTLSAIGLLRHKLGLNATDSWFVQNYPDFVPRLRPSMPRGEPAEVKPEQAPPEQVHKAQQPEGFDSAAREHYRWLIPVLLGIIVVSCLVLAFTFF
jgi:hypothetical protein